MAINWANLFSGGNPQQQQPQQQSQQPPQQQPTSTVTDPNVPALDKSGTLEPRSQENPKPAESPLDRFAEVFNMEKAKGKEGEPAEKSATDALFNVDPAELKKVISEMDFTPKGGNVKELLGKIQSGDTEALTAFINQTNQNSYLQQTQFVQKIAEQLAQVMEGRLQDKIPSMVKKLNSTDSVFSEGRYNHGALKPVVQAVTDLFSQKYPDATPAEISQNVNEYMKAMSQTLTSDDTKRQSQSENQNKAPQPNWGEFFGGGGSPF